MERFKLENDIRVFGLPVETFPTGIGETFEKLVANLPKDQRTYYGISLCTKNGFVYLATALETYEGEGNKYGYQNYTIQKGEYYATVVKDWRTKTDLIKFVFQDMLKDERVDTSIPCIEIYKNNQEMLCLVGAKKELSKVVEQ